MIVAIYNMKGGVGKIPRPLTLRISPRLRRANPAVGSRRSGGVELCVSRASTGGRFRKKSLQQIDTLMEAIKATDYDNLDLLPADFAYRKLDRFLHRLDRPDRDLAEVIRKLGRGYTHVLLDCPPGLSMLSENVFLAADFVLVPTIPTVLSLRTLARLVEHVGHRGTETKVTAFLSMVDRRKALHRHISKWAMQYPEFFLSAQVPYASVVEQMCVRRMPLAVDAPQDAATIAFDTLWCDLGTRLAEPVPTATSEQRRSAAFAKSIRDLIAELGGEADHEAVQYEHPLVAASAAPTADVQACEHRIRLAVHGEEAFESLGLKLSADAPLPCTSRLAHIFDTDDGILLRDGYLLQLLEEHGAFAVALEMLCSSRGAGGEDRRALGGGHPCRKPLSHHRSRASARASATAVVSAVVAATGKQPLRRVSWRKRSRRHLGPVLVPYEEATVTLHFEFDRISSPGSKVDYEVEATATGSSTHKSEDALRQLFLHAGIKWQPLTVQHIRGRQLLA